MKITFRWYGSSIDPIPLKYVKQIPGMTGLMGLLDKQAGENWPEEEFVALKKEANEVGLEIEVIESVNVHEDIKLGLPIRDTYISNYEKWEGDQSKLTSRDSLRITIDTALRMQPDGFDALMQLMEEAGCWIKRGAHVSIKPPGGERYIRLDSLGAEYSEAALRKTLDGQHVHIPKIPRSEYTYSQVKRLIDIEAKLRDGRKGRGYIVWAERNNIDAKAQSIIFLKEHNIGSIEELEVQISALRAERNELNAEIRHKQNRMKEINQLRQAIRDYRRTKDVYAQYKASGCSPKFYNEHRAEIEDHKKAQAVYSSVEGKMPTLKELSTEYEALKSEKEADDAALEGLKPKLTTLNHIKYNFDVLERDYLPEEKDLRREENSER